MEGVPRPARMVCVPENPGRHSASPLVLTLLPTTVFPAQIPFGPPTHQATSLLVNGTFWDDIPKRPVAVNCTFPPGKFWASAMDGAMLTELRLELPPQASRK